MAATQTLPKSAPTTRPGGGVPKLPSQLPGKNNAIPVRRSPGRLVPRRAPSRIPKSAPRKPPQPGRVSRPTGPPLSSLQGADPLLLDQLFPPEQDPEKAPKPGECDREFTGGQCPGIRYAITWTYTYQRSNGEDVTQTGTRPANNDTRGPISASRLTINNAGYPTLACTTTRSTGLRGQTGLASSGATSTPISGSITSVTPVGNVPDNCGNLPLPEGCTPGGRNGSALPATRPRPAPQTLPSPVPQTPPKPTHPPGETEIVPFKRPQRPPQKEPTPPPQETPKPEPEKPTTPSEPEQPTPPPQWDPEPPTKQPTKPPPNKEDSPDRRPQPIPPVPAPQPSPLPTVAPKPQPSPEKKPGAVPQPVPAPNPQPTPTPQPGQPPQPTPQPLPIPQPQPQPHPQIVPTPAPGLTPQTARTPALHKAPKQKPSPTPATESGGGKQPPSQKSPVTDPPSPSDRPSSIPTRRPKQAPQKTPEKLPVQDVGEFPSDLPEPQPDPNPEPECECNPPLQEDEETMVIKWKTIQVPVVQCFQDANTGVFTPIRKFSSIQIISTKTGDEASKVAGLYEELAATNEKLCEQCNASNVPLASIPDLWELKAPKQRDQMQIQYAKVDNSSRSRWHLTIPHFNEALKNSFIPTAYQKGKYACNLELPDASYILVNAISPQEGLRVIEYFNTFVISDLQGHIGNMKYSYLPGRNIQEIEVKPVFLKLFAAQQPEIPSWTKRLN